MESAAMTTYEEWQRELDYRPGDSLLRMAYADWLEENGSDKAEGYRILGRFGLSPSITTKGLVSIPEWDWPLGLPKHWLEIAEKVIWYGHPLYFVERPKTRDDIEELLAKSWIRMTENQKRACLTVLTKRQKKHES